MDGLRVTAIIVTYNRLDLLKLSLEKLLGQTYAPERIIIVDNASTDGTAGYLKGMRRDGRIVPIRMKKNLGGAGGFFHGMRKAYELGCDLMWIMDDDVIAEADALEKLIAALSVVKEERVGFLSSNVLFSDGTPCLMNISRTVFDWNEFIHEGIIGISHSSFVSMLIPVNVVEEVGLPIREYFLWGDDAEYSTRIIRAGYRGYQVGNSTVFHYRDKNTGVDIFRAAEDEIGRYYFFFRNITTTDRMRGGFRLLLRIMYHCWIIVRILLGRTDHKLLKSCTVLRGTVSGMRRKPRIVYVGKKKDE